MNIYSRPDKPNTMVVTRRDKKVSLEKIEKPVQITVDKSTECHVTPEHVADTMVEYLGGALDGLGIDVYQASILEPQAGTGNLIQAMISSGIPLHNITAVERHWRLCGHLKSRFEDQLSLYFDCFLEWAQENKSLQFDGIITNPPFSKVRQHMGKAYDLLKEGGAMVALVPMAYSAIGHVVLEELPVNTFSTCTVATKIILVVK